MHCPADDPRPADHCPQPAAPAATAEGETEKKSGKIYLNLTFTFDAGAADCAAEVAAAAADQAVPAAGLKTFQHNPT